MPAASEYQPTGTINTVEDIYIEGGPDFWFGGVLKYGPDANNYYWGTTGTAEKPIHKLGCYTNFQWADNIQSSDIRCDVQGVVGNITRRNYLEATFDLMSFLPLSQLKILIRASSHLAVADAEYMGIGEINQQDYHMTYFSKIYDTDTGDYLSVTGHRCQFEWSGAWAFKYGEPWAIGIRCRFFADTDLPSAQRFATVIRYDPSAL
jgi:hypothetical protein